MSEKAVSLTEETAFLLPLETGSYMAFKFLFKGLYKSLKAFSLHFPSLKSHGL